MFVMARDGDNYLKLQLHRVGARRQDRRAPDRSGVQPLDRRVSGRPAAGRPAAGRARRRPAPCGISPDNKFAIDVYQTHDTPPATRLVDAVAGKVVAELAASDLTKFDQLGLKKAEMFTFTGRRRQDDACGASSASRRTSIRRRGTRR